jgi:hypothetical protein
MHDRGTLTGREIEMPKIAMSDYLIHLRGLAAAALFLLGSGAVHAVDDCLTKPTPGDTKGGHWYYQTNQATRQKCWYLTRPGTDRVKPDATEAQAAPSPAPAPLSPVQRLVNALTGNSENKDQQPAESGATPAQPAQVRGAQATTATKRPRHVTRRVSRPIEHPATLSETQRDTLFRDFLNWEAQRKEHESQ